MKRKLLKPSWVADDDRKPVTPAQLIPSRRVLPQKDLAFCLLIFCGVSQVDAYAIAYGSRAARASVCSYACHKRKEPQIQRFFEKVKEEECNIEFIY